MSTKKMSSECIKILKNTCNSSDNQQLVNDIKYVLEHLNDVTLTTECLSTKDKPNSKRRYVTFIDSPKIKNTIGVMWFG